MFRVLIVDDEQPVLDGIKVVIQRSFEKLDIVGSARSGREAIEKAENLRPDIVFMDVRMPGISGLDAIREIRRFLPDALFILVTAYERFDIAKEAFDLGVAEYLLKPVNKDRLIEVLNRTVESLEERKGKRGSDQDLRQHLDEARHLLEPEFFRVVQSRAATESGAWRGRLLSLAAVLQLGTGAGRVALVEAENAAASSDVLRETLRYKCQVLAAASGRNRVLLYFPDAEARDETEIETMTRSALAALGVVDPQIAVGMAHSLGNIDESLAEAAGKLSNDTANEGEYPYAGERALVELLLYKDEDDVSQALRAFCEDLRYVRPKTSAVSDLRRIATVLLHSLGQRTPEVVADVELPDFERDVPVSEAEQKLFLFAQTLMRARGERGRREYSPVVTKAIEFIQEHFGRSISLEDAAQASGISPQYLSRIFSEEMHESFIDYLTRVRMQKARQLLRDGNSIKAIALELGYTDPNYFSRLFKKVTGLTPKEFART